MIPPSAVRWRIASVLAAVVALGTGALSAQGPSDETRFVIGISGGWITGSDLWHVADQPYQAPGTDSTGSLSPLEHLMLGRRIKSSFLFTAQAVRFTGEHLGLTAEFASVGMGFDDTCRSADTACYRSTVMASSATSLDAGIIYRIRARQMLQPYLRLMGGITLLSNSTRAYSVGTFASTIAIYPDNAWSDTRPTFDIGVGASTNANGWMQWRLEARETGVLLSEVTGPSALQGIAPPSKSVLKIFPSITLGIDIILARSVSTRY